MCTIVIRGSKSYDGFCPLSTSVLRRPKSPFPLAPCVLLSNVPLVHRGDTSSVGLSPLSSFLFVRISSYRRQIPADLRQSPSTAAAAEPSVAMATAQQLTQLGAEDATGAEVDDDVAGEVRHPEFLDDDLRHPVVEVRLPRSVAEDVLVRHRRVPGWEAAVEDVGHGHRKRREDQVERDDEEHDGRRRGCSRLRSRLLPGADDGARQLTLSGCNPALFGNDQRVEDDDEERGYEEDESLRRPGVDVPEGSRVSGYGREDLRAQLAGVVRPRGMAPKVRLDRVQ